MRYPNDPSNFKPHEYHERLSTNGKMLKVVLSELFDLTPRQVAVLVLRSYMGLSSKQIAKIKMPENSGEVDSILDDAKKRLRDCGIKR